MVERQKEKPEFLRPREKAPGRDRTAKAIRASRRTMQARIDNLQNDLESEQKALADREEELQEARDEWGRLEAKVYPLEQALEEARDEWGRLEAKVYPLEQALEEAITLLKTYKAQLKVHGGTPSLQLNTVIYSGEDLLFEMEKF